MKKIFYIILVILVAIFQTSKFSEAIAIANIKPNFVIIFLLFFAACQGQFWGELLGFICGLTLDLLIALETQIPLGMHSFTYTIVGFLSGMLKDKFYINNILLSFLLVFITSFFSESLVLGLNVIFVNYREDFSKVLRTLLALAFYNALITPLIFYLLNKIFNFNKQPQDYIY
jgi:rod shape-determining protein MreD